MKLFALQTDEAKLIKSFLSADEEVVLTVKFSAFLFVMRTIKSLFLTLILVAMGVGIDLFDTPVLWTIVVLGIVWFFVVFLKWVTGFIDWRYDVLIITTEEIVFVDQSSLFRVEIRQMNLENIASVSSKSRFGNIFPFGELHFELKEGTGKTLTLDFVPHADRVASVISNVMVTFERRRAAAAHSMAHQ